MRRAVKGSDGHARNPLHQQTLIEDRTQRFQSRWWCIEETLRAGRPELIHDDPVRHIHESEANRWFVRLSLPRLRPTHGFEKRQRERSSDRLQACATIHE